MRGKWRADWIEPQEIIQYGKYRRKPGQRLIPILDAICAQMHGSALRLQDTQHQLDECGLSTAFTSCNRHPAGAFEAQVEILDEWGGCVWIAEVHLFHTDHPLALGYLCFWERDPDLIKRFRLFFGRLQICFSGLQHPLMSCRHLSQGSG